jgi:hypothetical protein
MTSGESGGEIIVALWAMFVPIIMMFLVLVPPYFFCIAALYMYYGDQVFDMWDNVGRILITTEKLIRYGINTPNLDIVEFYLPVMGSLVVGIAATMALLVFFVRYIRGIFRA